MFVMCIVEGESSNECNPSCDGVHLNTIPSNMRKLLPLGYSAFIGSVSPRRAQAQKEAAESLASQAFAMQRLAERRMGRLPVVGDMVQVPIPDIDRSKMDAPCLTAIIIEVKGTLIVHISLHFICA